MEKRLPVSMKIDDILQIRLANQQIARTTFQSPAEVVSWMLAMQAQDFAGAKWSVALRLPACREQDVDDAIAARTIIRTWPMRGTLHLLAADDARWMLKLLAPRMIARAAGRYRQLELTEKVFSDSIDALSAAMDGRKVLTRSEVYQVLEKSGISTSGQRGIHIIGHLSQTRVLCHGPHQEKQPAYVLMDDWLPATKDIAGEEALATLALRYFTSHGPATIQDFIWWTGLTVKEARLALHLVTQELESIAVDDQTFWMGQLVPAASGNAVYMFPGFDEYMLGYTNRGLMVPGEHLAEIVPGNNGMFMPTIVINGQVAGTWRRTIRKDTVIIEPKLFKAISSANRKLLISAAQKYGSYLDKKVVMAAQD
ncbi:winged helix DNA-binding domain-containing protein [Dyadobacter sandarakinus]|uniref:Winged helix DNA-binding domain-containing protein n=1 Tax=Dyadobacter sandarakinus TaxID=2747268 RepID=A0ABX7IEN6_9BACT|nr:winged helix DNA-binding domain-containing protein [Dyadobacter sandarakinus]QRR03351.1 winged helix DNA-binding domain-containing protein [Dyadobacter sandarakinus]